MFHPLRHYLLHLLQARTRYAVHSPFVYTFADQVLPDRPCPADPIARRWWQHWAHSGHRFEIEDLGAGYGGQSRPRIHKTAKEVLRSSARRPREGRLLHRLCAAYQPGACLELGTNLGFSTLYQASAVPQARFISIEGAATLAHAARTQLQEAGISQVEVIHADFAQALQHHIDWSGFRPAHILLDGNHRREPTLEYFRYLLPRAADGAIFVLDDIYWSPGMTEAWREIVRHPEVSISIDLYHLGICAVRRPQAKEHFRLRF